MTRKARVLRAHQDVLNALTRLDVLLAEAAPTEDPYRETILDLIAEFGRSIDAIRTAE